MASAKRNLRRVSRPGNTLRTTMQNRRSQSEPMCSGNLRLLLSLALLVFCSVAVAKAAPRFTASLDRNAVVVGETVTLKLSFEGGSPKQISPLPQIDGLQTGS